MLLIGSTAFAQKQVRLMVNFDFNKYDITTTAAAKLDSIISSPIAKTKGLTLFMFGHCDSIGNNDYNDALSEKRVEAVKQYLLDRGLGLGTITEQHYLGKREPLSANTTEQGRLMNRRVELLFILPPEEKVIEKPIEKPVEPVIEKPLTKIIQDTAVKAGTRIALQNLNFYGGTHTLLQQSMPVLEELLSIMQNNPGLVIAIEGHVCCIPDKGDGVNFETGYANLSEMRAKTVYTYLLEKGIDANRISFKGFGHKNPIYPFPERTEQERVSNRRVEIRIISK